jgi:hypothetical protein
MRHLGPGERAALGGALAAAQQELRRLEAGGAGGQFQDGAARSECKTVRPARLR